MNFNEARAMMRMALENEINDDPMIIDLLSSPGSWDYYSQINGQWAQQSYHYLYQYYYDQGIESPNIKIADLIYEIILEIGSEY